MTPTVLAVLLAGSVLAAIGQVFLKLGVEPGAFETWLNVRVGIGFACYAFGMMLWMCGLSKAPLSLVYPFTMLTFVLVGLASVLVLGEKISATMLAGWAVICLGLVIIQLGARV